ncbi:family 10 glycosylhydrolase [Haladaptatus pallidirubidus]|uniref:DUF4015 domain-containing protein n=1 Tax=Haladaptatus pallidirubidus TaxID=1008152 RepID=A0AAV3UJB0_9EURY|nr:family 10 glycosylhydrolase [Haladaptatus pallidirubidus]
MTAVWSYPWALYSCGLDEELERLADIGVDALNVASHYHSVQTLVPRSPDDRFTQYPGGCYFAPDPNMFTDTPISPRINEVNGRTDALATIVNSAARRDIDVNAWTVCLHNSRLGAAHPEFCVRSAFGDAHDHSLCPSHPEVRTYFAGIVASLADYDVSRIDLESIGFPNVFHGHGANFGHQKEQVLTTPTERFLLSQCFCEGCRSAARNHPVDMDTVEQRVRELLRDSFRGPNHSPPSFATLIERDATLDALVAFRASVIERFVTDLAAASGEVPLNYYVADGFGPNPDDGWPAGVRPDRIDEHLDAVTAMCYTEDFDVAVERVEAVREQYDASVNAAVTLDPSIISTESAFHELTDAIRDVGGGPLNIYNHSLMGEEQVRWLSAMD